MKERPPLIKSLTTSLKFKIMLLYKPLNKLFQNRLEAKKELGIGINEFNRLCKYTDDIVFINSAEDYFKYVTSKN